MKQLFRDYLFTKHILVNDPSEEESFGEKPEHKVNPETECFSALVAMARRFAIRITKGAELANLQMIRDAAINLGEYVPEPFYRGFPQSVRELTKEQRLFDQLYHYTQTYGMGWFGEVGHSTTEEVFRRLAFDEKTEPKDFQILTVSEAEKTLKEMFSSLLAGTRPLNEDQRILVSEAWKAYGKDILPDKIGCRKTAAELLCETRNVEVFGKHLELPDVIKVLECIQYRSYHSENLKKLNLRNQDRKLITKLLDNIFDKLKDETLFTGRREVIIGSGCTDCFEKKQIWCGMLHHIHYQPKTVFANIFVRDIRGDENFSVYSVFEDLMQNFALVEAAEYLKKKKGSGALLRNLDYILSRCESEEEVKGVLSCLTD